MTHPNRLVPIFLSFIVVLAAGLRMLDLERADLANLFYASSIRSMGLSWHHFFYAAFDPAGTITVDKPPLALWIQVAFTKLLGFNGTAMILPMAISSTVAVIVAFLVGRKIHGVAAGLCAALVLAVFPESVATSRDTTMDAMIMLFLFVAAWLFVKTVEEQRPWLLVPIAVVLGAAFNIKFFQAFMLLPAASVYVLWRFRHRWQDLIKPVLSACVVGAVISLSWATIVDLTPKDKRPQVMNDASNSALGLALRYNGLERVISPESSMVAGSAASSGTNRVLSSSGRFGIGNAGPLRLIMPANGALLGFGVCLALGGLFIVALRNWQWLINGPGLFWAAWLVTGAAFFSASHRAPAHYTESYVPAIAILAGVGLAEAWQHRGALLNWGIGKHIATRLALPGLCALLLCYAFLIYDNLGPLALPVTLLVIIGLISCALLTLPEKYRIIFSDSAKLTSAHSITKFTAIGAVLCVMLATSTWVAFASPRTGQITNPNPISYLVKPALANNDYRRVPTHIVLEHYKNILPNAKYRFAITGLNDAGESVADSGASVLPIWNNYQDKPILPTQEFESLIIQQQVPVVLVDTWVEQQSDLSEIRGVLEAHCQIVQLQDVPRSWATWDCVR